MGEEGITAKITPTFLFEIILRLALRELVSERAFAVPAKAVRIEIARLGADAGALGAVALVVEERAKGTLPR